MFSCIATSPSPNNAICPPNIMPLSEIPESSNLKMCTWSGISYFWMIACTRGKCVPTDSGIVASACSLSRFAGRRKIVPGFYPSIISANPFLVECSGIQLVLGVWNQAFSPGFEQDLEHNHDQGESGFVERQWYNRRWFSLLRQLTVDGAHRRQILQVLLFLILPSL